MAERRVGQSLVQRIAAVRPPFTSGIPRYTSLTMKRMKTLKFKDWNRSFVPFETRLPTRWELFRDSPMRYVVRQAYEAYATLSPRATKQPGFSWPSDTIIRIVCISDTHSLHHRLPALPPGDILIHAGDLTDRGRVSQTRKALSWLNSAPHPHKVFIAGNHDAALAIPEKRRVILADYPDLIYLQDSGAELTLHDRTVTLYGTPRTPRTAQNRDTLTSFRTSSDIKQWMEAIPENTDILITHGPPLGHRDVAGVGCRHLLARLWHVRPLLHVFGHIHAGHGVTRATWSPIQTIYEGVCTGRGWRHTLRAVFAPLRKAFGNRASPFRSHRHTLLVNASSLGRNREPRLRDPIVIDLALSSRRRKEE